MFKHATLFETHFPFPFPLFVMFHNTEVIFDSNSTPQLVSQSSAV